MSRRSNEVTTPQSLIPAQRRALDDLIGHRTRNRSPLQVEGGVLPPSLIALLSTGGLSEGLSPVDFHLGTAETVRDAASRAWSYLRPNWLAWREQDKQRADGQPGTGPARDRWLLPLLRELGYGQLPVTGGGITLDDVTYPVSHEWQHVPIHLLGPGVDLDRRSPGVAGAARAPQAMLQELLNRSEPHVWAVLSNGLRLRLLRDSTNLVGAAYLEFDLEAIFDGEQYAEWFLLYQLCHVSRLEKRGGPEAAPADCWLEAWRSDAEKQGARALERLRAGVEAAIQELGSGFLKHPGNAWLVTALRGGALTKEQYHRMLLRLVYRLLFVFVAEDRELLLDPAASDAARARYQEFFSTARLRHQSRVRRGSSHGDLWQSARLVLQKLGDHGLPELGLPALGGLFDPDPRMPELPDAPEQDLLLGAEIANVAFLSAVRRLSWMEFDGRTQQVDYRHLGAEELGGVYESLLELVPEPDLDARDFRLVSRSGNERKTTGSYYTPASLVSALLDSALDPVIEAAAPMGGDPLVSELALLELKVCDPACGSGGFLVAAARRIARRLAEVRAGDEQPSREHVTQAMRDVVGHCVYGVDLNDLAAELAQVSLWLEAMQPGKPLRFLGHRVRVGNALMGTTPALLRAGVPDEAFKALEGDDKTAATEARKRNALERKGQRLLFDDWSTPALAELAVAGRVVPDDIDGQRQAARDWRARYEDPALVRQRLQADAWCAAFVWPLGFGVDAVTAPTTAVLRRLGDASVEMAPRITNEVLRLAGEYRFFHWHLEFPEVFRGALGEAEGPDGWAGGFDCLVGNPPWEHVELKEQEFFASRDPELAEKAGAARKRGIAKLENEDPALFCEYTTAKRHIDGVRHFLSAGRFPLTGRGRVKTDSVFAELFRGLTADQGMTGLIVPTGIATDATTQHFFKDLVSSAALVQLVDFQNKRQLFAGVTSLMRFCLLTMTGRGNDSASARFAFELHDPSQISTSTFALTPEEINLLNPNTGTCPVFRSRRDAEITLGIYRRVPVLIKENDPDGNPWGISFKQGLFNMTTDSHLFRTRDELEADGWTLDGNVFVKGSGPSQERMLPLYEAKMIHHYDHRWATYERDGSVRDVTAEEKRMAFSALPRYWVPVDAVSGALESQQNGELLAYRRIARTTDERTLICTSIPMAGVGDSLFIIRTLPSHQVVLQTIISTFATDFVTRTKVSGVNLNFFIVKQLALPSPSQCNTGVAGRSQTLYEFLLSRAAMIHEGRSVQSEIEAAIFHAYGIDRSEAEYILDTFPIVRRREIVSHGTYRTKELILEVFDAMQVAIDTGIPYESPFDRLP